MSQYRTSLPRLYTPNNIYQEAQPSTSTNLPTCSVPPNNIHQEAPPKCLVCQDGQNTLFVCNSCQLVENKNPAPAQNILRSLLADAKSSGGQKRKLCVGMALIGNPKVSDLRDSYTFHVNRNFFSMQN